MNSVAFECRDAITREQAIICLTRDGILEGFKVYLTDSFFPGVTIYRTDESKIGKRDAKRILNAAKSLSPNDIFID